jgi:pimeloyl-ACP methyl ester carboxylesterase/predicted glycosyltransferase
MRARLADTEGFAEYGGVKIHYEVYGSEHSGPSILLMPSWTLVHKRFWKGQIPFLARQFRVVVYDGPGNGRSDRPLNPDAYAQAAQVAYALKVLDATATDRAVLVALSMAANWALDLAANHTSRVHGSILIGPTVALGTPNADRAAHTNLVGPLPTVESSQVPLVRTDPPEHWAKYNREYWLECYDDFLWFFMGQCFSEPHSTKQIQDGVSWGRETTGAVLAAKSHASMPDADTLTEWCGRIGSPVLLIHGEDDRISPVRRSVLVQQLTGGELVTLAGGGHIPLARDPVQVNLLIREFAQRFAVEPAKPRQWARWDRRRKRVLYLCSPIGLGHARRDVAVAAELRSRHPDLEIDWLAQHPVTAVLQGAGERIHPASAWLANESAHIEHEAGEHDLHCFEALRRMDEILIANFMVFHDVVQDTAYDLVIADEAWDVDHFLHENPELKRFAYAWFTDFVGYLPMPDGGDREIRVTADYNAEMIEHIARFPRIRDRALFVGDPDDIVDGRFGPDLPRIRDWTQDHYDFTGYITGFDPAAVADRAALRADLGYRADERVCVVTVGGSGVGQHLLRWVVNSFPEAARRVPGLRMVVVTGPRIDPASLGAAEGLEIRAFVPDLYRHLAASDLAIVQGGLTTCMELTAAGRPFIYIPLRHHFEQQFHVAHRLRRHNAGRRLDYEELTPDVLAAAIATEIGREVAYRPVDRGGAGHAADRLSELL